MWAEIGITCAVVGYLVCEGVTEAMSIQGDAQRKPGDYHRWRFIEGLCILGAAVAALYSPADWVGLLYIVAGGLIGFPLYEYALSIVWDKRPFSKYPYKFNFFGWYQFEIIFSAWYWWTMLVCGCVLFAALVTSVIS